MLLPFIIVTVLVSPPAIVWYLNDTSLPIAKSTGYSSLMLSADDMVNLNSLADRLKQPSRAFDIWLATNLSPGTRSALATYKGQSSEPTPLKQALLQDINKLLRKPSIYEEHRFVEITLRDETHRLLLATPNEGDLIKLNRLLLEDACPREFARIQEKPFSDLKDFVAASGQIGDSIAAFNASIAVIGLLFVAYEVKIQREQLADQRKQLDKQKEEDNANRKLRYNTELLSAVNSVKEHYGQDYWSKDKSGILEHVAKGHRRWAVRTTFSVFDENGNNERDKRIAEEVVELQKLLKDKKKLNHRETLERIALFCASLHNESRLRRELRDGISEIYSLITKSPNDILHKQGVFYKVVEKAHAFVNLHEDIINNPWRAEREDGTQVIRRPREMCANLE